MAKFALIFFVVVSLIAVSRMQTLAHDLGAFQAIESLGHHDNSDASDHGHDHDDTDLADLGHGYDAHHDPADHSHQVIFSGPLHENHFPGYKSGWICRHGPDLALFNAQRIDRPPQALLLV